MRVGTGGRDDGVRHDGCSRGGSDEEIPREEPAVRALLQPVRGAPGGAGQPLLCSVPDVPAALAEFRRVLRPGGQLRFYEHVRSRDAIFARYQRTADLIWPRLMGGCHVERRTQSAIGRVFTLERCRGFRFPPSAAFSPVAPRIIGMARKADTPSVR
jgi:hypothetical protein